MRHEIGRGLRNFFFFLALSFVATFVCTVNHEVCERCFRNWDLESEREIRRCAAFVVRDLFCNERRVQMYNKKGCVNYYSGCALLDARFYLEYIY